jgi:hypothetical protein
MKVDGGKLQEKRTSYYQGSEVLTTALLTIDIFWDMMLSWLVNIYLPVNLV